MRPSKSHRTDGWNDRERISDRAIAELVRIVSIFSCCGPSNAEVMERCDKDTERFTTPFIEDGQLVGVYWSFRDSSRSVRLNAGSFGTQDRTKVQEMIDTYVNYRGDPADAPFQNEMHGLKLVWQLSLNPNARRTLHISDELVRIARNAFKPRRYNLQDTG
jgi:hypothetical protein